MFFYPQSELVRTPRDVGVDYEDVEFLSRDGKQLHGWFLPAQGEAQGTVVFFHGNAENISTHLAAVYWLPAEGFNVFLHDYRGYGRSQGKAELHGVHLDAAAALDYVRQRPDVDPERLVVFGESLGGAIAIYTMATQDRQGVRALVVESTFASYRDIFQEKLAGLFLTWPLQWPLSYTVPDTYSPLSVMGDLGDLPLLIIHGDQDRIIPVHHAQQLYQAAPGERHLWLVEGGRHTEAFTRLGRIYRPRLVEYLRDKLGAVPE